jgi:hypothetical protein
MSDGVLAAIIAAGATVFTSFLQLRTSFAKEFAARGTAAASKRKSRLPLIFMTAMLIGAAVGGFALAQWLHEYERVAQDALQRDLRERIAELSRTHSELEQTRAGTHADVEAEILRRMGTEGVVVLATVAPCKAPLGVGTPTYTTPTAGPAAGSAVASSIQPAIPPSASACTESDAAPISLCASVPASATLTDLELYVRAAETSGPWTGARAMPGQELEQARFAEKPTEVADGGTSKQVCEGFAQWSARSRTARMVVHYSLSPVPQPQRTTS